MPPKAVKSLLARFLDGRLDDEVSSASLAACYGLDEDPHPYKAVSERSNGPPPLKKLKTINSAACESEKCMHVRPRCLNWLGQARWEDEEKAIKALQKQAGLGADPHLDERDPDTPVGLKSAQNLGATCFMNSFLQVWYQHPALRAGIFACNVDEAEAEKSPLYQLQVIFAMLQEGRLNVCNPKPLVTALRIDQTEQQDAQEFAKLFMTLLDNELAAQAMPALKSLIKDLFEGKLKYRTKCTTCGNEVEKEDDFNELTLNLKANCTLEDCIERALADEQFTGNNQYFCGQCASNQDAVRKTIITDVPPVLHFSLLRFQYDLKAGDRKKVRHTINVPRKIDMCDRVEGIPSASQIYDLRGVLLHKGQSAHHGHYVAQVWDTTFKRWFTFDDENVQTLEKFESQEAEAKRKAEEERKKTAEEKKSKNRGRASIPDSEDEDDPIVDADSPKDTRDFVSKGDSPIKTGDAYMLIYVRRDAEAEPNPTASLPPLVHKAVDSMTDDLGKRAEEFEAKNKEIVKQFEEDKSRKEKVWTSWSTQSREEEGIFVDRAALAKWIGQGLADPTPPKVIDLTGEKPKVIKSEPNGGPKSDPPAYRSSPGPAIGALALNGATVNGHSDAMEGVEHVNGVKETNGIEPAPKSYVINSRDMLCPHGKVTPRKASAVKVISKRGLELLQELDVSLEPCISTSDGVCRPCLESAIRVGSYQQSHPQVVKDFREANKVKKEGEYWISSAWLQEWLKPKPNLHDTGTGDELAPESDRFRSDIFCDHGDLAPSKRHRTLISSRAVELLKDHFPDWQPVFEVHAEACDRCAPDALKEDQLEEDAKREREGAKTLLKDDRGNLRENPLEGGANYIVVPKDWLTSWRTWVKKPAENDRPGPIDCERYFCEHDLLIRDMSIDADRRDLVLVTGHEYAPLRKEYDRGRRILVKVGGDLIPQARDYGVCEGCREEKRLDFEQTWINVHWLGDDDFDKDGNRLPALDNESWRADSSPLQERGGQATITNFYGKGGTTTRSGRRTGLSASTRGKRKPERMSVLKFDTVKDMKQTIQTEFKVFAIYQRVFYKGEELLEDMLTVDALRIGPEDKVEVYVQNFDDDKIDVSTLVDVDVGARRKRKSNAREEGFAKTGLHGFQIQRNRSQSEELTDLPALSPEPPAAADDDDEDMLEKVLATKSCPTCTYLNPSTNEACEMCTHAFL